MTQELPQGVPDLRARVMRGLAWVAASQVVFHITRAIAAILIARLLTPDEYGLAALAIVFASLGWGAAARAGMPPGATNTGSSLE